MNKGIYNDSKRLLSERWKMMITIKDVAQKAGVSTATVSRVLNQNYPVSKEVEEKVMEVVKDLNYRPNAIARSLKNKKTFIIGMVVRDISNPFFMDFARGVENIISPMGYSLIFCSTDGDAQKELQLLRGLRERQVDFVLLATSCQEAEELNGLIDQGLNIIMFDTKLPGFQGDTVVEDNFHASYKIVEYALQKGHQKIGIVNGPLWISTAKERYDGAVAAMAEKQIPITEQYIVEGAFDREISREAVRRMLQRNRQNLPTLIFGTNNNMTEGAMIGIKEQGLKIPEDISIISFGDLTVPLLTEPRITMISQNAFGMGQRAGEVLIQNILEESKKEYQLITIESEIIIRNSVKTLV